MSVILNEIEGRWSCVNEIYMERVTVLARTYYLYHPTNISEMKAFRKSDLLKEKFVLAYWNKSRQLHHRSSHPNHEEVFG